MANKFLEIALTESVLDAQRRYFGRARPVTASHESDALGDDEIGFIKARDSFYMATVTENGWPYVQHRGGKPGFLHVLDSHTLAFADYKGNRQLISTGNLMHNDRVALFLMDYPNRARLKILGHARVVDAREHLDLIAQITEPDARTLVERLFLIEVVALNWNCSQYITPRYTVEEIRELSASS
jgi:predicted pyridoxine 5'-phosphate oxidase superfamily flavin-nucleotide-binding protein